MVVWCRICGALMGVREPYTDWVIDRNALCACCAEHEQLISIQEALAESEVELSVQSAGIPD